jgi:predicted flap endonuclease-1-like 5' DNA nuclease
MSNTTLIIVAIFALLIIGAVILLRGKSSSSLPQPAPKPQPTEGHGFADGAAAAVLDVSTPLLGIDAHPDLPSDELTLIKGLGPKAAAVLNGLAIHRYAQLAGLDAAQANELDSRMGAFRGRLQRDRWIDQARLLEQGDVGGFEAEFGKIG